MATVFVAAHGSLGAARGRAVVPPGMTVKFFTGVGLNLLSMNGLEVVRTGQTGQASGEYGRGAADGPWVQNYTLSALEDDMMAAYLQLAKDESSLLLVGDGTDSPIQLCAGDGPTNCQGDTHDCSGLLAHAEVVGCDEVVILACRHEEGGRSAEQAGIGGRDGVGDTGAYKELEALADWMKATIPVDRAAVDTRYDQLTPEQQVELNAYWSGDEYLEVRGALYLLATEGDENFERYHLSREPMRQEWMAKDPTLTAALERRRAAGFAELPGDVYTDAPELEGDDLEAWVVRVIELHGPLEAQRIVSDDYAGSVPQDVMFAAMARWAGPVAAPHLEAMAAAILDEESAELYFRSISPETAFALVLTPECMAILQERCPAAADALAELLTQ